MTFSQLITRLLASRLNLRDGYWLQFKLGKGDTFTVSLGVERSSPSDPACNIIYRRKLGNIIPQEALQTVIEYLEKNNLFKQTQTLFNNENP